MTRPKSSSDAHFKKKVESAIDLFEKDFKQAVDHHEKPLKLSIANVTKRYEVSRSRLYRDFPDLLKACEDAFARMRLYKRGTHRKKADETVASCRAEIIRLKKLHKAELSKATSLTVSKVIEQLGPAFREKLQLIRERQAHLETIEGLEQTIARLQSLVEAQMQMLERREVSR